MNATDTNTAAAAHPAPPIPCEVDLRDFHFMPLDVVRLQNSETWAIADGWGAKALVNLWTRSWHQVPAGSLPDDDNLHIVGYGDEEEEDADEPPQRQP